MKQIARDYLKKYSVARDFSAVTVEFYLVDSFEIEHFIPFMMHSEPEGLMHIL